MVLRLILRIFFLGFMLGKFKKKNTKNDYQRGFVDVIFPLPAKNWTKGNDFLWRTASDKLEKIKKGDRVVFFGYHTPTGWKAKMLMRL